MKRESGFTLIELLLVLAIIGIISAIAIPALLGQRARARDKSSISNMDGRIGDLVGQYDKLREAGIASGTITTSLEAYLNVNGGADKNPWNLASAAFNTVFVAGFTGASTQTVAYTNIKAGATVKGQAVFGIQYPGATGPGFIGGAVLIDGIVNSSNKVAKVTSIE
jgi:prepilin-type N-terminal cleavage/methylation domain-containing protein